MLADTSVWIDHLRNGNPRLVYALEQESLLIHEFVVGELACGNLRHRREIMDLLAAIPRIERVQHNEVLAFADTQRLAARGLGWIDVHLLASCVAAQATLLTLDGRLRLAARSIGISAD